MKKEFGKWLMDIAKYIATAVILSSVFGEIETTQMYAIAIIAVFVSLLGGLLLVSNVSFSKKELSYGNDYNV